MNPMESLNDSIWTDEEVFIEDMAQPAMSPPCSISIPSCDGSGSGGEGMRIAGNFGGDMKCGC